MGEAGTVHGKFQRYLERGLKLQALAAAADMHTVGVEDALVLCLLLRGDTRYERAAARWHAQYILEKRLPLAESRQLLSLLELLATEDMPAAATALSLFLRRRGMRFAVARLEELAAGVWPAAGGFS